MAAWRGGRHVDRPPPRPGAIGAPGFTPPMSRPLPSPSVSADQEVRGLRAVGCPPRSERRGHRGRSARGEGASLNM